MSADLATMPEADFRKLIYDQLLELKALVKPGDRKEVLSVDEAVTYTGHNSRAAFYRWTGPAGVEACKWGGYTVEELDNGKLRIAAKRRIARKKL